MKITHVSVEGVGRFAQAVTIANIAPGLNVLAAPNEAGKSTLFKAVRACMFEKHTAKSEAIRDLASDGASLPATIELGFEHLGAQYVVRKTFLSSARASLTKDGDLI
jgi:DNA repair exonuclease SbcCD ATPase subunit